jgi:hypothetical protein
MSIQRLIGLALLTTLAIVLGLGVTPTLATPNSVTPTWGNADNYTNAYFGSSVRPAGDVNKDGYDDVIIGASGYNSSLGRAFIFYGSAQGPSRRPNWVTTGSQTGELFGISVNTAGDVNKDGFDDVMVGSRDYDGGMGKSQGRATLYLGSANGPSTTPDWETVGASNTNNHGISVGYAGDLDKDGYPDVAVGGNSHTIDLTWQGVVQVYKGQKNLDTTPTLTLKGTSTYSRFGYSTAPAGDFNNDGVDDLIVGAYQGGYPNPLGNAFVFFGQAGGMDETADWTATGDQADARFGIRVNTAGDFNNDNIDDVIVSASWYDVTTARATIEKAGRIDVFFGSAGTPDNTPDWTYYGDQTNQGLGYTIGTLGDVNGDGIDDIYVGASGYDQDANTENIGVMYIFYGTDGVPDATPDLTLDGFQAGEGYGSDAAMVGDINGDGYNDLLVSASRYDGTFVDEGRVFLFPGKEGGLETTPTWSTSPGEWGLAGDYLLYLPLVDMNHTP